MAGETISWNILLEGLFEVVANPLTEESQKELLDIIHFDGRLSIEDNSELPHSMSPKDMLKSLAVQALVKWTGLKHVAELRKLQSTTHSSSLRSLVRDVINKV